MVQAASARIQQSRQLINDATRQPTGLLRHCGGTKVECTRESSVRESHCGTADTTGAA